MPEKKDFFISYNGKDKNWAEWIAWHLEEEGYTTLIQAWDFGAGKNFVLEMDKATKNSLRTIIVLSQNYLDAVYTHPEWAAAFANDPTGEKQALIPIRIAECKLEGLLKQIVYLDLVGMDEGKAREKLLNEIRAGRLKPVKPPVFPGSKPPQEPVTRSVAEKPEFPTLVVHGDYITGQGRKIEVKGDYIENVNIPKDSKSNKDD